MQLTFVAFPYDFHKDGVHRSVIVVSEVLFPNSFYWLVIRTEFLRSQQIYHTSDRKYRVNQRKNHQNNCVSMDGALKLGVENGLPKETPEKGPVNQIRDLVG